MLRSRTMSTRIATTTWASSDASRTAVPEAPAARRREPPLSTPGGPRPSTAPLMGEPGGATRALDGYCDVDGDTEMREVRRQHGVLRGTLRPVGYAELEQPAPGGGDPHRRLEPGLAGSQVGPCLADPG